MARFAHWMLLVLPGLASCEKPRDSSTEAAPGFEIPVRRTPRRAPEEKLSADLESIMDLKGGQNLRVLADLSVQVDLDALGHELFRSGTAKQERRRIVVTALRQVAEDDQRALRPHLENLKRRGLVQSYRGFSIANRLLVIASPAGIRALAAREEVAAIHAETETELPALTSASSSAAHASTSRSSWAIAGIGADRLWHQGLDGTGIVVGIIDAGASAAHEQLRGNFRSGDRSWYDPAGGAAAPRDAVNGHGTGVLSAAVGQNVAGVTVGVAPGAVWVACAGLPDRRYNNVAMTECADWMLNTGAPDILINAWILPDERCDPSLREIVNAWRAAEILPVFAAGNDGPRPETGGSPANYVGLYPGQSGALAVGGITADGSPFRPSSRGPNNCDGSTYPTLVAPSEDVTAAFPLTTSAYIQTKGTSVAAGFVAGAAALMLQRHPEAAVQELEEALRVSALDSGVPGPDNTFGYGRLYVPAALDSLASLLERKESTRRASDTTPHR